MHAEYKARYSLPYYDMPPVVPGVGKHWFRGCLLSMKITIMILSDNNHVFLNNYQIGLEILEMIQPKFLSPPLNFLSLIHFIGRVTNFFGLSH